MPDPINEYIKRLTKMISFQSEVYARVNKNFANQKRPVLELEKKYMKLLKAKEHVDCYGRRSAPTEALAKRLEETLVSFTSFLFADIQTQINRSPNPAEHQQLDHASQRLRTAEIRFKRAALSGSIYRYQTPSFTCGMSAKNF